jgi:hypothetical protein
VTLHAESAERSDALASLFTLALTSDGAVYAEVPY